MYLPQEYEMSIYMQLIWCFKMTHIFGTIFWARVEQNQAFIYKFYDKHTQYSNTMQRITHEISVTTATPRHRKIQIRKNLIQKDGEIINSM